MNAGQIKAKLDKEQLEATWAALRTHHEQGRLIWVSPSLFLTDVGTAVALDDTALVSEWMASGDIVKPSAEQVEQWNEAPLTLFMMVIVQPFVLFQEIPATQREELMQ